MHEQQKLEQELLHLRDLIPSFFKSCDEAELLSSVFREDSNSLELKTTNEEIVTTIPLKYAKIFGNCPVEETASLVKCSACSAILLESSFDEHLSVCLLLNGNEKTASKPDKKELPKITTQTKEEVVAEAAAEAPKTKTKKAKTTKKATKEKTKKEKSEPKESTSASESTPERPKSTKKSEVKQAADSNPIPKVTISDSVEPELPQIPKKKKTVQMVSLETVQRLTNSDNAEKSKAENKEINNKRKRNQSETNKSAKKKKTSEVESKEPASSTQTTPTKLPVGISALSVVGSPFVGTKTTTASTRQSTPSPKTDKVATPTAQTTPQKFSFHPPPFLQSPVADNPSNPPYNSGKKKFVITSGGTKVVEQSTLISSGQIPSPYTNAASLRPTFLNNPTAAKPSTNASSSSSVSNIPLPSNKPDASSLFQPPPPQFQAVTRPIPAQLAQTPRSLPPGTMPPNTVPFGYQMPGMPNGYPVSTSYMVPQGFQRPPGPPVAMPQMVRAPIASPYAAPIAYPQGVPQFYAPGFPQAQQGMPPRPQYVYPPVQMIPVMPGGRGMPTAQGRPVYSPYAQQPPSRPPNQQK